MASRGFAYRQLTELVRILHNIRVYLSVFKNDLCVLLERVRESRRYRDLLSAESLPDMAKMARIGAI